LLGSRVNGFRDFAEMSASRHERLNGRGYHRGMRGDGPTTEIRALGRMNGDENERGRSPLLVSYSVPRFCPGRTLFS